jgi:hypothetical protein
MDFSRFSILLEKAFLEYRIRQTRHRLSVSLNSFATYLDFSPPIVNLWLTGNRLPTQGNVERIIPKLVELLDVEVYDLLGLPRPDPDLQRLSRVWTLIPKEFRHELADQGEKYAAENGTNTPANKSPAIINETEKIHIENNEITQSENPSSAIIPRVHQSRE